MSEMRKFCSAELQGHLDMGVLDADFNILSTGVILFHVLKTTLLGSVGMSDLEQQLSS